MTNVITQVHVTSNRHGKVTGIEWRASELACTTQSVNTGVGDETPSEGDEKVPQVMCFKVKKPPLEHDILNNVSPPGVPSTE